MTDERRRFLLAVAARHAERFDAAAQRRGNPSLRTVVPLRPPPPAVSRQQPFAVPRQQPTVTPRQLDVLSLIAEGHMNIAIGHILGISEDTVKSHVKNLFQVLNARNRTHAVAIGFRTELLSVDEELEAADAPGIAAQQSLAC
jgi:DNA-binding NarL/FixJ family response regulator